MLARESLCTTTRGRSSGPKGCGVHDAVESAGNQMSNVSAESRPSSNHPAPVGHRLTLAERLACSVSAAMNVIDTEPR